MRHARDGESDWVRAKQDSNAHLRGTEFKVASRTPETVAGQQPLMAGTIGGERQQTDITNSDGGKQAASSPDSPSVSDRDGVKSPRDAHRAKR